MHAFLWSSGLFFKVVRKFVILKLTTVVLILMGFPMSVLKYLSVALILTQHNSNFIFCIGSAGMV